MNFNEKTKSMIRHFLTSIGSILVVLGFAEIAGAIDILTGNFDAVWEAVVVLVGVVMDYIVYFGDKDRFDDREVGKVVKERGDDVEYREAA